MQFFFLRVLLTLIANSVMSAVAAMARTGEYATVGGSTRTSTVRPWFTSLISREWITAAAHCCTCFDATHSTFSLSVKPVPVT